MKDFQSQFLIIVSIFIFLSISGCLKDEQNSDIKYNRIDYLFSDSSFLGLNTTNSTFYSFESTQDEKIESINISFNWDDEPSPPRGYINTPDTFNISVQFPNGDILWIGENSLETINGSVTISQHEFDEEMTFGNYTIHVALTEIGSIKMKIGPEVEGDMGNIYYIDISIIYRVEIEE